MIQTLRRFGALASLSILASAGTASAADSAKPAPAPSVAAPAVEAAPAEPILPVPLMPTVDAKFRACSAKTASGLGYTVLKAGNGPKPSKNDFVLINYIGYLAATGAVFDQNAGAPLNLDVVIPGFAEGLLAMPRGSVQRLCIPAALGYGAQASAAIPANSDLVFQIELIDSKSIAEVEKMRTEMQQQQAAGAQAEAPAASKKP